MKPLFPAIEVLLSTENSGCFAFISSTSQSLQEDLAAHENRWKGLVEGRGCHWGYFATFD